MVSIADLYSQKKYNELIERYIKRVDDMRISSKVERNERNAEILYYLLGSCYEKGYYCDLLHSLKKLDEIKPINLINWNVEQVMFFSNVALEALIYSLFNNDSEELEITYPITDSVDKIISFQNELMREHKIPYGDIPKNLRTVYADYKEGKLPIYTVEFQYPFEPIIPNYTFDLQDCNPYISMRVERVPRDTDSFTSFTFKAYGFINSKFDWEGPRWETRHKFPAVKKALPIANLMLLQAVKASPGKMVLPYNIEQVSTVSMYQYCSDGERTVFNGLVTGTDFTAHWIGNNSCWHIFTQEELQELNRRVIATYGNKAFVTTFHHATNLLSGGFYTESFLLFCFCCEGFIYHWCEEIAKICGEEKEYQEFAKTKQSPCNNCDLYVDRSKEPHNKGIEPTLFASLKYLREKKWINSTDYNSLRKLVSKIRQDDLRNDIVHGRVFGATKANADESLAKILEMQDAFLEIIDKCKKEKS